MIKRIHFIIQSASLGERIFIYDFPRNGIFTEGGSRVYGGGKMGIKRLLYSCDARIIAADPGFPFPELVEGE